MDILSASQRLEYNNRMLEAQTQKMQEISLDFLMEDRERILQDLAALFRRETIPNRLASAKIELNPEVRMDRRNGLTEGKVLSDLRAALEKLPDAVKKDPFARTVRHILELKRSDESAKIRRIEGLQSAEWSEKSAAFRQQTAMILRKRRIELPMLGAYDPSKNRIILYYNAVRDQAKSLLEKLRTEDASYWENALEKPVADILWGNLFTAYLSVVLAREYVQVLQYRLRRNQALWDPEENDVRKEEVKDAPAEYYAVVWGLKQKENREVVAKDLYDRWVEYGNTHWPSAAALNFFRDEEGKLLPFTEVQAGEERFFEVFFESLRNWKLASKALTAAKKGVDQAE